MSKEPEPRITTLLATQVSLIEFDQVNQLRFEGS